MASLLLKFPAELRNLIWDFALTSDNYTLHYNTDSKRYNVSNIGAGLLTTCRTISAETLYTPLRLNTLVFDVSTITFMDLRILSLRLNETATSFVVWTQDRDKDRQNRRGVGKTEPVAAAVQIPTTISLGKEDYCVYCCDMTISSNACLQAAFRLSEF